RNRRRAAESVGSAGRRIAERAARLGLEEPGDDGTVSAYKEALVLADEVEHWGMVSTGYRHSSVPARIHGIGPGTCVRRGGRDRPAIVIVRRQSECAVASGR